MPFWRAQAFATQKRFAEAIDIFAGILADPARAAALGGPPQSTADALVLFDTQTKRTIPVGYGILSADEIMDRIFMLTNTKVGSDY